MGTNEVEFQKFSKREREMKKQHLENKGYSINFAKHTKRSMLSIAVLFILCIAFFAAVVQAATLNSGNTVIGNIADTNDANAQSVSYFMCSANGLVTDIIAYVDGTSAGNAIAAIYAVNGNTAGALLEQSKSVNIGTTFSWVDFPLPTPYTVTSGTTYGLAIMGNVQLNIKEVSGTGQRDHNAVTSYANGFANPFGSIWGTDDKGAMSIYAAGTTSTTTPAPTSAPTPTATPTPMAAPTSTNLLQGVNSWYPYEVHPLSCNYNVHVDTNVVYVNGDPTIRIDAHTSADTNYAREADTNWFAVSPGQQIVFSCWMKTSASSQGYNGAIGYGARIGVSFYDSGFIQDISWSGAYTTQSTYQQVTNNFVPWNTNSWTLKTLSFVVPPIVYDANGVAHNPTGIIPWLQGTPVTDSGSVWFADATLTIIN